MGLVDILFQSRLLAEDEELASVLEKCRLRSDEVDLDEPEYERLPEYDEVTFALEMALIEVREQEKGFEDGKRLQATLEERFLVEEDVEKRAEFLKQTLI
jgi:hypothetical protein